MTRRTPYLDGIIWLAALIGAWGFLGNMIILPALPDMIQPLQIPETQIGYIISAFSLPGIFLTPFMGLLINKYGSRSILVFSLALYGVSGILGAFSQNFPVLLFWRLVQGVSAAPLLPLALILVGDHCSVEQRSAGLGALVSLYNIIASVLPLIGGFLAQISWQTSFAAYIAAFPCAAYAQRVFSRKSPHDNDTPAFRGSNSIKPDYSSIRSAGFIIPCLMASISYILTMGLANTYIALYLVNEFNFSASLTGIVTAIRLFITAIGSAILSIICARHSFESLYVGSFFITFLSYGWVAAAYGLPSSLLPILFCGFGHGIIVPLSHTIVYKDLASSARANVISLYQTLLRISQTIAPVLFGTALLFSSLFGLFVIGAILSLIGTGFFLRCVIVQWAS